MNKVKYLVLLSILVFSFQNGDCQINIIASSVNSLNVYPKSICEATIHNSAINKIDIIIEGKIRDASGILLRVKSNPVTLISGINYISGANLSLSEINYGSSSKSLNVRNSGVLPAGIYQHCITIYPINNLEDGDISCETIESDALLSINLVYPADKDTILTVNPNLVWNHSEPFASTGPTESYRIILVEIKTDQNVESAINTQRPIFIRDFLSNHLIPYPLDAHKLESGKRYGWQVQKVVTGQVSAKSEAWEFVIKPEDKIVYNKYAIVGRGINLGFYYAIGHKLFFKFEEEYTSSGVLTYVIKDNNRNVISLITKNEEEKSGNNEGALKNNGDNRFEIDLNSYNLKDGFYLLEIKNEKNELFNLKFYVGQ